MRNVMRANFFRLRRNVLFYAALLVMFLLGVLFVLASAQDVDFGYTVYMDHVLFCGNILVCVAMAAFIPLFFGTEHSDGGLRNKLAVGASRRDVYLANLVTAVAAAWAFCAAYFAAVLLVGPPLLSGFEAPAGILLLVLVGSLTLAAAFSALYLFAAMLCSNKAAAAATCVLAAFLLLIWGLYLNVRLDAPENNTGYALGAGTGAWEIVSEPNPYYLQGTQRAIYQFLYDLTPGGQALQYSAMATQYPALLAVYACVITGAATGGGVLLFKRKDLK